MSYVISLIGRPNVGKSTIFNRLTESKKAIVEDFPGVTRDRLYEKVKLDDKEFQLIDTGGITLSNDRFNENIKIQASIAIDESDLILFVVDGKMGLTSDDQLISQELLRSKKDVIILANKLDNSNMENLKYEFYSLGFTKIIGVSAIHANGFSELFDELEEVIPENEIIEKEDVVNFSLIGRPNVGKSSLFNALVGTERVIVSSVEGTTRDSIDTYFEHEDKRYKMIDTAGIKRRGKIYEKVDKYSVLRSLKAIEKSDIVLWLIDAEQGLYEQDKKVLGYALEEKKPVIIVVNKWDLVEKETNTQKLYAEKLKGEMPFLKDHNVVFLSALTTKGVNKLFPIINDLYSKYTMQLTTSQVNKVLNEAVTAKTPPSYHKKPIKFYYATQIGTCPPKFLFFVNNKDIVHFSYKRYLENYFKKTFNLKGISLSFMFKNKNEEEY